MLQQNLPFTEHLLPSRGLLQHRDALGNKVGGAVGRVTHTAPRDEFRDLALVEALGHDTDIMLRVGSVVYLGPVWKLEVLADMLDSCSECRNCGADLPQVLEGEVGTCASVPFLVVSVVMHTGQAM